MMLQITGILFFIILYNLLRSCFINSKQLNTLNCGIVGFSGKSPLNPDKILYLMQQNSWKRGRDATGFYSPETGVKKDAKVPEEFLIHNSIPLAHSFIGHVRAGTSGSKGKSGAHPFEFTNIVGVHNGTLTNQYSMMRNRGIENGPYSVDSEMLYKLLDDNSEEDKIVYSTLSEFDGAAALLFQDKRNTKVLYAYRNNDRPLYYGYIDKNMYISSLEESLKIIGCISITLFNCLNLYKIEEGKIISTQWFKEYEQPKYIHKKYKNNKDTYVNPDFLRMLPKGSFGEDDCDQHCSVSRLSISDSEYVININKFSLINNNELHDRWIRVLQDKLIRYGDTNVKFTKDDWYFVSDYNVKNNYEIFIESDDNGEGVWAPKFIFDVELIKIGDYVVTMNPILNAKGERILDKNMVLEVYDPRNIINGKHCVEVLNDETNATINVFISSIRCATKEEENLKVEEKNKKISTIISPVVEESPFITPIEELSSEMDNKAKELGKNFFDGIDDESTHASQDVDSDPKNRVVEELIPSSIYDFVLNIIITKVLEIQDIAKTTNLKELQENVDELDELLEECYDLNKITQWAAEAEDVKENSLVA